MRWQTSSSSQEKKRIRRKNNCTLLPGRGEKNEFCQQMAHPFPLTSMDSWHLIYRPCIGSNGVKKGVIARTCCCGP